MSSKTPRILIVDDERENRDALVRALGDENPNWVIQCSASEDEGRATLAAQLENGDPVDVILTDLVMTSEQNGMNVLQEARRLGPFVMAILFTAKEKSLDRYAAFDYGAFDVVEKNIRGTTTWRELNIKARAALRYREWSQRISFLRRCLCSLQARSMISKTSPAHSAFLRSITTDSHENVRRVHRFAERFQPASLAHEIVSGGGMTHPT